MSAIQRYRQVLMGLVQQRRLAGGSLDPEVESSFIAEADACWRELGDHDQEQLEAWWTLFSAATTGAPRERQAISRAGNFTEASTVEA